MENDKRKRARRLLDQIGEIDDRFIENVLDENCHVGFKHGKADMSLNNVIRFALTAAACLAVVLSCRYVQVKMHENAADEEQEYQMLTEQFTDSAQLLGTFALSSEHEVEEQTSDDVLSSAIFSIESEEMMGDLNTSSYIYTGTQTLEEAEEKAGFEISLPDIPVSYSSIQFFVIEDNIYDNIYYQIDVLYLDELGDELFRISKASGTGDFSLSINDYSLRQTIGTEAGTDILLCGNTENEWLFASWDDGSFSYAIAASSRTFTTDEITHIAATFS